MRQLGGNRLEDDPGRRRPGKQEARTGLEAGGPGPRQGAQHQEGAGKGGQAEDQQVGAGRRAMRLLARADLGRDLAADAADLEIARADALGADLADIQEEIRARKIFQTDMDLNAANIQPAPIPGQM